MRLFKIQNCPASLPLPFKIQNSKFKINYPAATLRNASIILSATFSAA
jgi:hypothetical protein